MVPTAAALTAVAMETYDHFTRLPTVAALLASATLMAVAARMGLAFLENQRMLAASRREASQDALTGLGNRRELNVRLVSATALPPARGVVRLLILLDLDGFKAYNDSFGHPAGDSLLVRLGARLAQVAAPYGRAFRLGGDEFCVLVDVEPAMCDVVVAGGGRGAVRARRRLHDRPLPGHRPPARRGRHPDRGAAPGRPAHVRRQGPQPLVGHPPDARRPDLRACASASPTCTST